MYVFKRYIKSLNSSISGKETKSLHVGNWLPAHCVWPFPSGSLACCCGLCTGEKRAAPPAPHPVRGRGVPQTDLVLYLLGQPSQPSLHMWLFPLFQASPSPTEASPISKASDPLNWYLWGWNQDVWIKHNIPPGDSNAWPAQVTVISTEFYELDLFHALANRIWLLLLPFLTFLAVISDLLFVPFYLNRLLFCWSCAIPCRSIGQYTRLRPLPPVDLCTGRFWLPASQASISFSHPQPLASLLFGGIHPPPLAFEFGWNCSHRYF